MARFEPAEATEFEAALFEPVRSNSPSKRLTLIVRSKQRSKMASGRLSSKKLEGIRFEAPFLDGIRRPWIEATDFEATLFE